MRKIIVGIGLMVATATPGFGQSYCACYGTGNVIDTPLLEKTSGAYGYASLSPREPVQQRRPMLIPPQWAVRAST